MNNELKNELKIELSCSNCSFTKVITVGLDKDGVFTIPDKFCPRDLTELKRDVLRTVTKPIKFDPGEFDKDSEFDTTNHKFVMPGTKVAEKSDAPTENKTKSANTIPKPTRPVEVPKHGSHGPKKS